MKEIQDEIFKVPQNKLSKDLQEKIFRNLKHNISKDLKDETFKNLSNSTNLASLTNDTAEKSSHLRRISAPFTGTREEPVLSEQFQYF